MTFGPTDELPHEGRVDEWVFAAWTPDGSTGFVSGHRLVGRRAWYWSALVQEHHPMLHLAEWEVRVRADPFIVKAPELWAEHICDAPLEQWSVGNEAHAVALDDADDGLGRAYGTLVPMASDLEWYATEAASAIAGGYEQRGVVHGVVELLGRPDVEFVEAPAHRWRRWSDSLAPIELPVARAHTGLRATFAFPDGSAADWVLGPDGWRSRVPTAP